MLAALIFALAAPVVGYSGDLDTDAVDWVVVAPGQRAARFVRPLPERAEVSGAEVERDAARRIVAVSSAAGLDFVVRVPLADAAVRAPFLAGPAVHRVLLRGPALDFSGSGLRSAMHYRAAEGVSRADREHADDVLGSTTFGAMPIYLRAPGELGDTFAVARVSASGGRGAVGFVVAAFGVVLMALTVLYRRLGRRARWEKTKVRVERIVREPLP